MNLYTSPQWIKNAILESFCIHVRGLMDFLFNENPRPDDVVAGDYFEDPGNWVEVRGEMSDFLKIAKVRVGKEVAHLTYGRLDVTPDKKKWEFLKIFGELNRVIKMFLVSVQDEVLDKKWQEIRVNPNLPNRELSVKYSTNDRF